MRERLSVTTKKNDTMGKKLALEIKKPVSSQFIRSINSPVDYILSLQRTIGNQAVQRLLRSGALQAKLKISQPGNIYEQEADRVADAVMRLPTPGCTNCKQEEKLKKEEEFVQTKPIAKHITPIIQRQPEESDKREPPTTWPPQETPTPGKNKEEFEEGLKKTQIVLALYLTSEYTESSEGHELKNYIENTCFGQILSWTSVLGAGAVPIISDIMKEPEPGGGLPSTPPQVQLKGAWDELSLPTNLKLVLPGDIEWPSSLGSRPAGTSGGLYFHMPGIRFRERKDILSERLEEAEKEESLILWLLYNQEKIRQDHDRIINFRFPAENERPLQFPKVHWAPLVPMFKRK